MNAGSSRNSALCHDTRLSPTKVGGVASGTIGRIRSTTAWISRSRLGIRGTEASTRSSRRSQRFVRAGTRRLANRRMIVTADSCVLPVAVYLTSAWLVR
jgi:hypothetical protein